MLKNTHILFFPSYIQKPLNSRSELLMGRLKTKRIRHASTGTWRIWLLLFPKTSIPISRAVDQQFTKCVS